MFRAVLLPLAGVGPDLVPVFVMTRYITPTTSGVKYPLPMLCSVSVLTLNYNFLPYTHYYVANIAYEDFLEVPC